MSERRDWLGHSVADEEEICESCSHRISEAQRFAGRCAKDDDDNWYCPQCTSKMIPDPLPGDETEP